MSQMKSLFKPKPQERKEWKKGFCYIERPVPVLQKPDEVKLEIQKGGICGTDLHIYKSKESLKTEMSKIRGDGVIIGHEFCGKIVEAGSLAKEHIARLIQEQNLTDGKLKSFFSGRSYDVIAEDKKFNQIVYDNFYVSAEMHTTCGKCYQCRKGEKHVCQNTYIKGIHEDGAFAKYMLAQAENLSIFPENEIPPEIIAFMDAIGNSVHTIQTVNLIGSTVAVLGCGVQGLLSTAIAHQVGATQIFVTDFSNPEKKLTPEKVEKKRFTLARKFGADFCFDVGIPGKREEFVESVKDQTAGTGVDFVVEMSGSYSAYEDAFRIVRKGGTILLLGIPEGTTPVNFSAQVVFPGVTIKGIIGRKVFESWETMRQVLKANLAKKISESGFITHRLPLSDYEKGFAAMESGEALKVILEP